MTGHTTLLQGESLQHCNTKHDLLNKTTAVPFFKPERKVGDELIE